MIVEASQICTHRLVIVTGHYGTGKTEFSVNLALGLARNGEKTMLADLDNVNPYFRSREKRELLESEGIRVISTSQECSDADIPAVPAEVLTIIENESIRGIMDIGGDPVGARVLGRFRPKLLNTDYQLVFVSNANRPEVREADQAITYLRSIEQVTGLTCSGIINNTHLCGETTPEEVVKGAKLADEVSEKTGIPVLCHVVEKRMATQLPDLKAPVFPVTILMKKPWEA